MTADLQNPAFQDDALAREAYEAARWPHGPNCPLCGNVDPDKIAKGRGRVARPGLYYCSACNGQFTVTVGTVMERSKIPLSKWLLATHLIGTSKKGISAHQLHRMLGVTYKSAWFMAHRIREAMKDDPKAIAPLGGSGKIVEADELHVGKRENPLPPSPQRKGRPYIKRGKSGPGSKRVVIGLVERGGRTRLVHIQHATKEQIRDVVVRNVSRESALHTDESNLYCGEAHLHRYLNEFAFRHNHRSGLGVSDKERVTAIMAGIDGKRLTYRRIGEAAHA